VSLDPGVRTFLTFYGPDGCGKIGKGDFGRIVRLCVHLDALRSKRKKATGARRLRLKKALWRHQWKIKNLIDELHHKAAKFLVDNFDLIFLPKFDTQQMIARGARAINSKTVRMLVTWAHYRFRQFLLHKANEHGKTVVLTNEAWTTRTVSWTGEIVPKGSFRNIRSRKTGEVMDRDYNGARGIFLRALVDLPSELKGSVHCDSRSA
jgi:putative transposase